MTKILHRSYACENREPRWLILKFLFRFNAVFLYIQLEDSADTDRQTEMDQDKCEISKKNVNSFFNRRCPRRRGGIFTQAAFYPSLYLTSLQHHFIINADRLKINN